MFKNNLLIPSIILIIIISVFSCKKSDTGNDLAEYYDFTGKNIEEFFMDSEKLVVLNYWATYCAPCKKEMIDFSKLNTEYKEKVLFIGASIDSSDKISLIKKLCSKLGVNYSILYGVKSNFRGNEITGLPTTYILRNGKIKEEITGKRDYEYFKNAVEKYLAGEKKVTAVLDEQKKNNIKDKKSSTKEINKDSAKKNIIINKFYEIEYIIKNNETLFDLKIVLKPAKGFYLNGDEYPPVKIVFKELNNFKINPSVLNVDGIKAGSSYSWDVKIDNPDKKNEIELTANINALACTNTQCNMVNDDIVFKY